MAPIVPRLRGRFGTSSQAGRGISVGLFVALKNISLDIGGIVIEIFYKQKAGCQKQRNTCHMDGDIGRVVMICSVLFIH